MRPNPYQKYRGEELSLRDHLAIDRTILSNERTALAYARTSLAMLIVGGSCIKFFESIWIQALGPVFIVLAVGFAWRGWSQYRRMKTYMDAALDERTGSAEHPMEKKAQSAQPPENAGSRE